MKVNKKIGLCIFLVIVTMFLINDVSAFGISPARKTINYQNGLLKEDGSFDIINKDNKEFDAVIYLDGDLKDYVMLDQNEISFKSDEDVKKIKYTVNLPANFDNPGEHEVRIIVSEVSKVIGSKESYSIGVKTELVHQIRINVPYPGKYAKAELVSDDEGGRVKFIVSVYNKGKEDIKNAKAKIQIYNFDELVNTIETDTKSVEVGYKRDLIGTWDLPDEGTYGVKAIVDYDGQETEVSGKLSVGNFFVKLLDIFIDEGFRLGGIAKFNVLVENIGNSLVKDLYSQLILNQDGENIADIKSANLDLNNKETQKMFIYWDTNNVKIGKYEGKVVLTYQDKVME